jgi:hypothetical protein
MHCMQAIKVFTTWNLDVTEHVRATAQAAEQVSTLLSSNVMSNKINIVAASVAYIRTFYFLEDELIVCLQNCVKSQSYGNSNHVC